MTESTDTMTNCRQSSSSSNNIVNLVVVSIYQQEYVNNENGDRHHLTLFDLQPVSISDHNLNVFDELSHQCNAALHSSNILQSTIGINNFHSSYLMPTTTMNDYERRFQRSLQKLTIPSWYTDIIPPTTNTSKQSIISTPPISWKIRSREPERTPEIYHVHRPRSYRSCRSSLATSPSPSIHSWHPSHMMDGMNFSLLIPSSSRRYHKYQKGIERVSKSSRWYQPTQFVANKPTKDQTGIIKIPTSSKNNHYDTPQIRNNNDDVEKTIINEQNNKMNINDKQQDNHNKSNESQIMPLANIKEPFNQIELVKIIDEDDEKQMNYNQLLERAANDLVQSVLADILLLKNLDDNEEEEEEDKNSGVRELSEDENGLRELDENDMNDTDEFIVFATNPESLSDDDNLPRYNLNKLYTFSKTNDHFKHQNSTKFILEKTTEQPFDKLFYTSPIYHSYFEEKSNEGVNEETARIGRLLLESIPISKNIRLENYQEEDDEDDKVRRDSAYSSNQERINIPQTIYEPLSECYSGYSFLQSDFLTSVQTTTTDEAYESEPTTICSSIATTTYVHPDLVHEFDYPSPPPPVPDRRLKPTYLKPSPPPTKPRLHKQNNIDSVGYSIIQKTKPITVAVIQQFLTSTSNDSTSLSTRTMSSRHYCGSIPVSNEVTESTGNSTSMKTKDKTKEKRNSRTLNCLHPSTTDDNQKQNGITKSSSSLNKTKIKKQKLITDFDEATNGLAIRLPAPVSTKQNLNRISTPLSSKQTNVTTKNRQINDNIKLNRPSFYETSV